MHNLLPFDHSYGPQRGHGLETSIASGQAEPCFGSNGNQCALVSPGFEPGRIYRYTSRQYLDETLANGDFYFNTLFHFATGTGLNDAQADLAEGGLSILARNSEGYFVVVRLSSLDCWTICFSNELSRSIMKRFNADCAFEILDYEFFRCLARATADSADIGKLYKIRYVSRKDLDLTEDQSFWIDDLSDPRIIQRFFAREHKHSSFDWQKEIRLCFEPRQPSYRAFVVAREADGWGAGLGIEAGDPLDVVPGEYEKVMADFGHRVCAGLIEPIKIRCPEALRYIREVDMRLVE